MSRPAYLFQIGVGRSGTTVLRKSIGLHPRIYYTGTENRIVTDFLRVAHETLTEPDRSRNLLVSKEQFDRILERALNEMLWQDSERIARSIRSASFAMPPELPPYLLQVFPNARILHLVRNGIQVIASRQLHHGFSHLSFQEQCERWARTYELAQWGQTQGNAYHQFRYEWFQEDTRLAAELDCVFDWLEIPRDDAPFENIVSQRYHPTQHPDEVNPPDIYAAQQSEQVREQADHIRGQRWQFWTEEQRAMFETICAQGMRGFGYPIPWQEPPPSSAKSAADSLSDRVHKAIFSRG